MSTLAFDYSAGRIAPGVLKAAGATAVFRYVSTPGNPKNITAAEYAELTAAGITVGLVYETTATWMLGGYGAGVAAAKAARAQAAAAGYPATHPLWYAADFDTIAHPGSLATVIDALHGCADADGSKALVRPYGDYAVIEAAYVAGFTGGWQTVAWSGGIWSAHALIRQTGKSLTEAGVQVDVDENEGPLFPLPPTLTPAAAAAFIQESSMQIEPTTLHPGEYALIVPPGVGQLVLAADGGTGPGAVLRVVLWHNDQPTVLSNLTVGGGSGHHVVAHPLAGATAVTVRRLDPESYPVAAGFRA